MQNNQQKKIVLTSELRINLKIGLEMKYSRLDSNSFIQPETFVDLIYFKNFLGNLDLINLQILMFATNLKYLSLEVLNSTLIRILKLINCCFQEYRSCIYSCTSDQCNSAPAIPGSSVISVTVAIITAVIMNLRL